MIHKSVIYIRTSSETQGVSSSLVEQEADCRHFAQEKGLEVVRIYRDVEKYRVGNILVEPSGSRLDRPDLMAMLKDATRDEFYVILAWREDRLYCGIRAILLAMGSVLQLASKYWLAQECLLVFG